MNGCGNESHYMRSPSEEFKLGRLDPVAGLAGVVVDTKTICEDDVLEAFSFSNVFVLKVINSLSKRMHVIAYIREICGFEDNAAADRER
jgi:hypothetical protein